MLKVCWRGHHLSLSNVFLLRKKYCHNIFRRLQRSEPSKLKRGCPTYISRMCLKSPWARNMALALAKSNVSMNLSHATVSSSRRRKSILRRTVSGRFLWSMRRLLRKLRYVLRGFSAGKDPPPRWYTTAVGTMAIFQPAKRIRQHKSISSMWAKNSGSRPPESR